jgi:hypothetical protein
MELDMHFSSMVRGSAAALALMALSLNSAKAQEVTAGQGVGANPDCNLHIASCAPPGAGQPHWHHHHHHGGQAGAYQNGDQQATDQQQGEVGSGWRPGDPDRTGG